MAENLLEVRNLVVNVEDKEILHNINLDIKPGETHVLMGPNGAGKSTLGYALMGNPKYTVKGGSINFAGEDITKLAVDKRAKAGLFLSFQNPLEVPGVTLSAFIRTALEQKSGSRIRLWDFKKKLKETMALLSMDESYAERDLNVGFSGGEKKRNEVLQMALFQPSLCILDEMDSGLDIDALRVAADGVNALRSDERAMVVITHYQRLLNYIVPDFVHVMSKGRVVKSGGKELALELEKSGYAQFEDRAA